MANANAIAGAASNCPAGDRPFGPDSLIWKLSRERVTLLYGPAAAIMQVAHPRVAAGVYEHSSFKTGTLSRLHRTLDAVWSISFGDGRQARSAAESVARLHATVRGSAVDLGVPGAPTYSANEPELLMWVVATLVTASIDGYRACVGSLSESDCQGFYGDMRRFGSFFGLDPGHGPQNWADFLGYWQTMVADESMGSHELSRRMAWAVASPQTWWLKVAMRPMRFAVSEVLPPAMARRLGFRSTAASRLCLGVTQRVCRAMVPRLPARVRFVGPYLQALGASKDR
jgi:uncharacterized protein (DUF2236 family)